MQNMQFELKEKQQIEQIQLKNNDLLKHVLKCSVSLLAVEFKLKNFGSNQIIKKMKKQVQAVKQNIEAQFCLKNWIEISYYLWFLSTSQKIFIEMVCNEQVYSIQSQIVYLQFFKDKLVNKIKISSEQQCKYGKLFAQLCEQTINLLAQQILRQFCQISLKTQQMVNEQIHWATQETKNAKFMNFYILFKILLDCSLTCYKKVEFIIESQLFKHLDAKLTERISSYLIKKFQTLKFQFQQKIQSSSKTAILNRLRNQKYNYFIAQNQLKQKGIFIQFQEKEIEDDNLQLKMSQTKLHSNSHKHYLISFNQSGLCVKNCASLLFNWQIQRQLLQKQQIRQYLQDQPKLQKYILSIETTQKNIWRTIPAHSMIGQCLADIKDYKSLNNFMLDLSKNMAFQTPVDIMVMMTAIPILGYLFTTGGYTYSFYTIFNNKFSTFDKKLQQIGVATLNTVSSLSTGIVGGFLGQAFIPIPIVGAFIGGLIGGLIGAVGGHFASNLIQKNRFKQLIIKLKYLYHEQGYWQINTETLKILGIDTKHFQQTIPQHLISEDRGQLWLSLLCFTLFSLSQAKQRQIYMKKTMMKLQKMQKQKKQIMTPQQYKQRFDYQTSINMVNLIRYLSQKDIKYLQFIGQIQGFIQTMYSRIV